MTMFIEPTCIIIPKLDFEDTLFSRDLAKQKAENGSGHGEDDKENFNNNHNKYLERKGFHNLVCRHWLRNLCMKGDEHCPYLHYYDSSRMPECTVWLRNGKCSDPDCIFRHERDLSRPDCENYKMGFCKLGMACKMRHEKKGREELPEFVSDAFLESIIAENVQLIPKLELPRGEQNNIGIGGGGVGGGGVLGGQVGSKNTIQALPNQSMTGLGGPNSITRVLNNLPPPTDNPKIRFVFIKSQSKANLDISLAKSVWATTTNNLDYLVRSFRYFDHVILVFSCKETKRFVGYAKMLSMPDSNLFQGIWGAMSNRLGANIRIHWMKTCSVGLDSLGGLEMQDPISGSFIPIPKMRDGMSLTDDFGLQLCRHLTTAPEVDLLAGTDFSNEPRIVYDPEMWRKMRQEMLDSEGGGGQQQNKSSENNDTNTVLALSTGPSKDNQQNFNDRNRSKSKSKSPPRSPRNVNNNISNNNNNNQMNKNPNMIEVNMNGANSFSDNDLTQDAAGKFGTFDSKSSMKSQSQSNTNEGSGGGPGLGPSGVSSGGGGGAWKPPGAGGAATTTNKSSGSGAWKPPVASTPSSGSGGGGSWKPPEVTPTNNNSTGGGGGSGTWKPPGSSNNNVPNTPSHNNQNQGSNNSMTPTNNDNNTSGPSKEIQLPVPPPGAQIPGHGAPPPHPGPPPPGFHPNFHPPGLKGPGGPVPPPHHFGPPPGHGPHGPPPPHPGPPPPGHPMNFAPPGHPGMPFGKPMHIGLPPPPPGHPGHPPPPPGFFNKGGQLVHPQMPYGKDPFKGGHHLSMSKPSEAGPYGSGGKPQQQPPQPQTPMNQNAGGPPSGGPPPPSTPSSIVGGGGVWKPPGVG